MSLLLLVHCLVMMAPFQQKVHSADTVHHQGGQDEQEEHAQGQVEQGGLPGVRSSSRRAGQGLLLVVLKIMKYQIKL